MKHDSGLLLAILEETVQVQRSLLQRRTLMGRMAAGDGGGLFSMILLELVLANAESPHPQFLGAS